tara:strand:+ start:1741 stop:2178 length:438 start_codon:yes stop_codon:yes gene_type:complete
MTGCASQNYSFNELEEMAWEMKESKVYRGIAREIRDSGEGEMTIYPSSLNDFIEKYAFKNQKFNNCVLGSIHITEGDKSVMWTSDLVTEVKIPNKILPNINVGTYACVKSNGETEILAHGVVDGKAYIKAHQPKLTKFDDYDSFL